MLRDSFGESVSVHSPRCYMVGRAPLHARQFTWLLHDGILIISELRPIVRLISQVSKLRLRGIEINLSKVMHTMSEVGLLWFQTCSSLNHNISILHIFLLQTRI